MQIFKNISNTPKGGEINHSVNATFDDDGNLNFTEHDMGDGVAEFWGRMNMSTSLRFLKKKLQSS